MMIYHHHDRSFRYYSCTKATERLWKVWSYIERQCESNRIIIMIVHFVKDQVNIIYHWLIRDWNISFMTSIYRLLMCHIDLELLLCCYFPMDQSNCMCCIIILCFSNLFKRTWQETKNELETTKCVVMIITTGATVNNNSAIKAADDHGIRLITIGRWESISRLLRLMGIKH